MLHVKLTVVSFPCSKHFLIAKYLISTNFRETNFRVSFAFEYILVSDLETHCQVLGLKINANKTKAMYDL